MEYANQIQKLTERSVSGCASECTHSYLCKVGTFSKK